MKARSYFLNSETIIRMYVTEADYVSTSYKSGHFPSTIPVV